MSLVIGEKKIDRVSVVDDDVAVREGIAFSIEDLKLEPILEEGPLHSIGELVEKAIESSDVLICDYQLKSRGFATFNGAEAVAELYGRKFPAILCTSYKESNADQIRKYRAKIPVVLSSGDMDADKIQDAIELCVRELSGDVDRVRRTHRALVRVEYVDTSSAQTKFFLKIPAWNAKLGILLSLGDVPVAIQDAIRGGVERLHAQVNLGAEDPADVYLECWETK